MKISGFVDLQVNGYKGVDFSSSDLTEESFLYACRELFKTGTAAFLPTLVTSHNDVYQKNLPIIAKAIQAGEFEGKLLGVHIEGPFISSLPGAVGAHTISCVRKPSVDYLKELQDLAGGNIKVLTIAAELEGAESLTEYAVKNGIVVSLGHQMALEDDLDRLSNSGAKVLTHLGNALSNQIDRHKNPLLAGLANEKLAAMIITDSHHIPDTLIKMIIKIKEIPNVIVVSDAASLSGMPAGKYNYWGQDVVLEESGYLHIPSRGCMAGSSATMFQCMNYLASLGFLNKEQLLDVGFYNPLKLIGVNAESVRSDVSVSFDEENNVFKIN